MAGSAAAAVKNLICVAIICLLLNSPPPAQAALSCSRTLTLISSCVGYVQRGGPLPPGCCDGVKNLNAATQSTPDLQAACGCVKSLLQSLGANPDLVNGLPAKCGIDFPFKYTPSLDCSKLHR